MQVKVINKSQNALSVEIIRKDGKKDMVFIQARSKVTLPEGSRVVPNFLARNPQVVEKEVD